MKVLVGDRQGDFAWAPESELVMMSTFVCDSRIRTLASCIWTGMVIHTATTTAGAVEMPKMPVVSFAERVRVALEPLAT